MGIMKAIRLAKHIKVLKCCLMFLRNAQWKCFLSNKYMTKNNIQKAITLSSKGFECKTAQMLLDREKQLVLMVVTRMTSQLSLLSFQVGKWDSRIWCYCYHSKDLSVFAFRAFQSNPFVVFLHWLRLLGNHKDPCNGNCHQKSKLTR